MGRLYWQTDALNDRDFQRTSWFLYDAADNLCWEMHPRLYDYAPRPLASADLAVALPITLYRYDALNRRTDVIDASNVTVDTLGSGHPVIRTRYNRAGRVQMVVQPARPVSLVDNQLRGLATSYAYNDLDQVTQIEDGRWTFGDPNAYLPLRREERRYDVVGNLTEQTTGVRPPDSPYQSAISITQTRYDALNRPALRKEAVWTGDERQTRYPYDVAGGSGQLVVRRR
ncbi:MAG: hypothetical protein HYS12_12595 [Planctomycetes bacterium]|nr:hypothetical protein [Planctomycetota bacterium]